ncbi:MAG: NADH-quinone oxidoreductase subunit J [Caldilineaceae bacterium]|nr:NADH-quinone oxidoreductase subunit J [Caldilineaceae bacterium]
MSWSLLFFLLVGAVSLAAALGVVTSRQPVHSALFLLTNFATLAVLYITLDAQFLAAAQVIVYAGGIVILILFVIMLIGGDTNDFSAAQRAWSRTVGIALGIILLLTVSYSVLARMTGPSEETAALLQGGTPEAVGIALFTKYVLPFELIALLLLVALIGALVLGRQQEGAGEGIPSVKANE